MSDQEATFRAIRHNVKDYDVTTVPGPALSWKQSLIKDESTSYNYGSELCMTIGSSTLGPLKQVL